MSGKNENSTLSMIKLGLILAIYAAVSCSVLAVVNSFTSVKIEQNRQEKINLSMKNFFPEDNLTFETAADFSGESAGTVKIENIIIARKDGKIFGGAVQVTGPTYDSATILTGIAADGTVRGLQFLALTDSPGFGLKASDSSYTVSNGKTFYGQFEGMNASDSFKINENFEAISGATITSAGIANLMNEGSRCLLNYFAEHDSGESNE